MRCAIDLQSCLTDSRDRGIGRYAVNLTDALLACPGDDVWLVGLDTADPSRVRDIRHRMRTGRMPDTVAYRYPAVTFIDGHRLHVQAAESARARFYEALSVDVVLQTSHFEVGSAYATGFDWSERRPRTAVIAYDLIPLRYPQHYLPEGNPLTAVYRRKLEQFVRYDMFLAISEATRSDLVNMLNIPPEKIVLVGAGLDPGLRSRSTAVRIERAQSMLAGNGIVEPFILTVGNGDWRKNGVMALETFAALPERLRATHRLVMTQAGQDVVDALHGRFAGIAARVDILGRIDDELLAALYARCEVFFFPSLYEGFGLPVLEAMAFGAPVLSSSGGALAEVVPDPRGLFDPGDAAGASVLLASVLEDQALRAALREAGPVQLQHHDWSRSARIAQQALRELAQSGRSAGVTGLGVRQDDIRRWGALLAEVPDAARDLESGLEAMAARGVRRILVDVSEVARLDARTGIQRVVRRFCSGLAALAPEGVEVQPIMHTPDGVVYASRFAAERLGIQAFLGNDGERVRARPNDLLFMLDSSWIEPERFDPVAEEVRSLGGEVVWMVYDLIPIRHPECCDPGMPRVFSGWLRHAAGVTDGFVCISEATRSDLEEFIDSQSPMPRPRPWTRVVHLGSDLDGEVQSPPSQAVSRAIDKIGDLPLFIAVGTIEPRKDYATIVSAFEDLIAGADAALCLVGKHGWNVDALSERLRAHPLAGTRLHWFESASDADLTALMDRADVFLQASLSEGFGLPVIEAGSRGKPLLLSDIPVFREVAGANAEYFPPRDAAALSALMKAGIETGRWKMPTGMRTMTWSESAGRLLEILLH
ncbi:glycosyltransferase family 4 protein [Solilutibacter oculi]|uniref:glycosyltransferase family 4 protein n=1 Tax=Solilutibacter oculi TaxID=2698682 RepID=UPI001F1AF0AA|nr:glycosyltransferase family 1 protein [Lysobacter oculi]